MSGPIQATSETNMLAISIPASVPHLLQHDPTSLVPMLPPDNSRPLNSLSSSTEKPKLSLKTSGLASTFRGAQSQQTGADPNATTTPTTLNTFNNTFDLTCRPSPVSTLSSPGPLCQRRSSIHPLSPVTKLQEQPYYLNLPFGVHSILKNSPLHRDIRRSSISASPRRPGRRVFFPAPKKVSFRTELEDEIVAKRYVIQHTDLSSSEDESTPSESDEQSGASNDEVEDEAKQPAIRVDEVSIKGRRKRKSAAMSPNPSMSARPAAEEKARSSPVYRSRRKRRRWEWTLGVENRTEHAAQEPSQENSQSAAKQQGDNPAADVVRVDEKTKQAEPLDSKADQSVVVEEQKDV